MEMGSNITSHTHHAVWNGLLPQLHELAQRRPPHLQHPYLAVTVSCGCATRHVDNNMGVSSLLALGPFFHGGGLVVHAKSAEGKSSVRIVKHQWIAFDASQSHSVQRYDGTRYSIALYVPGSVHLVQPAQMSELKELGFPVEWWLQLVKWRQNLPVEWSVEQLRKMSTVRESYPLAALPEDEELQVDEPMDSETMRTGHLSRTELGVEPTETIGEEEIETPSKGQQAAILRMHTNLGHPPLPTLLRAMRVAGVREGIRRWTKHHFICPACAAWRPAPQRRPAMLPKAYDFCVVVGIDVIHVALGEHASRPYLNIVDWGTRYVQAVRLDCSSDVPNPKSCLSAYLTGWSKVFGHPEVVVVDQGNEF
eukprot:359778-Amphidinium_carterae.1